MSTQTTVYLVGAGPGAPDLLTLRAARLLAAADIVYYDALVHPDTLALAEKAHKVSVGKRAGQVSTDQRFINRALVEAASRYRTVVRLKGGDPMLFGRAQEEVDALVIAGIAYEVVPGITAAQGASAQLGISLTRRGVARNVVFATPRVGLNEDDSDWAASVVAADTAILYMAAGQAARLAALLMARGKAADMPVVVVESATLPEERRIFTTLAGLAASSLQLSGPAVVCVGAVFVPHAMAIEPLPKLLTAHSDKTKLSSQTKLS
ncbi:MAG: uroporphyrinogen-III C-methyltransferase [Betaproteobacteria bacterium]|nr:uroporphyrinogen-III C-methyltransferase [Betaproteobacteria bacterium]